MTILRWNYGVPFTTNSNLNYCIFMQMLPFVMSNFRHYNAGALVRAFIDYYNHVVLNHGKMFLSMAGAMSSAELGITLAPAIRRGLVHGISPTGANNEESVFRLVADDHYKNFPRYRYHTLQDETKILERGGRRVTTMSIPEEEAFRRVEKLMLPMWMEASQKGERYFWHEYFYRLLLSPELKEQYQGDPNHCWLLAAAENNLPIVCGGFADSTFGNIFTSHCHTGECKHSCVKSDTEQFDNFYDTYDRLSEGAGVGFFQIGGGIAGDFPICIVPSKIWDLGQKDTKPWAYFCQISDSITSFGGYSGATPNEKITWGKLTENTPMHVIESDATIVFPLILQMLMEAQDDPALAQMLIAEFQEEDARREFKFNEPTVHP